MSLIIDANVISLVLHPEPEPDYRPIWTALGNNRAFLVHGGKLSEEYAKVAKISRLLMELDRKGSARKISDKDVDGMTAQVEKEQNCISNDEHIIALARVAKVRLLCSEDKELHADFTNPDILKPAGKVYRKKEHSHLIRKYCKKRK